MLFTSEEFLFLFLPLCIAIYYLLLRRWRWAKNIFLLASSIFFYAWGEPENVILMILVILVNWIFGILVDYYREDRLAAGSIIVVMLLCNLGMLGYYKYRGFVVENIRELFGKGWDIPEVILPIGISFFTFQAISYVIDVYWQRGKVQKNPFYVGLYISFFPQLIAGPIVRYETVAEEILHRKETWEDFSKGVSRFLIGFIKKVLIANNVAVLADAAFRVIHQGGTEQSISLAWLGAIAYTFQIFFDFSGYSDMAIGLGRMFGFHFEENFNYPYIASSVTEFWRRWHISLQTWFRDYVYFPLGGSRVKSKGRVLLNIGIVWLLTGIWHGANWTFVVWGLLYFILLAVEKFTGFASRKRIVGHVYTMFFVTIGWVIFRAENLEHAYYYLRMMFGLEGWIWSNPLTLQYWKQTRWFMLIALFASVPLLAKLDEKCKKYWWWNLLYVVMLLVLFALAISYVFNNSYNPFIYFNF